MSLTRIKVGQINGKMEIIEKQTGIIDDNPVVYHDSEDLPVSDEDVSLGRVQYIGRGFTALKKNRHPKAEDPKVNISIRIPLSYAERLRATGRGWQTRMSKYLIKGIKQGVFEDLST